ncbi:MAG: UDP-N-acetylmuramoyl-L-alanyl-D-glutamate--2,6-diaminopimelate ligase, partial [Acidimicrobiales bacterium]
GQDLPARADEGRAHGRLRGGPPAIRLDQLLRTVRVLEMVGDPTVVDVSSVTFDTRCAGPGALHCCLPGTRVDGHDLAPDAVARGAVALLCERPLSVGVVQACVGPGQARTAMAQAAATLWGHPSDGLRMAGITGTSGKTTVTHLLGAVLEAHGWPTAVLGTLGGARTTPEAPVLQEALARHRDSGGVAVAMEVSSHALAQHRVDAVRYDVAAFTNLSQEHLDFHGTMEAYFQAKAALFVPERAESGLANADDPWGARLLESAPIPMAGYSVRETTDLDLAPTASRFRWRGHLVDLHLGGTFNVANAVAAARVADCLGVPAATVAAGLSSLAGVPGRFEPVDRGQPFAVVVDYAHKPAALEEVLSAARQGARPGGRVIVVFGCGGDRDRAKRPVMGEVATRLADLAVLTSDNPRSEDPLDIISEVAAGVRRRQALVVEPDRAAAIALAVDRAGPGDVVVVAGKGHERGQETRAGTRYFDDREVAAEAIDRRWPCGPGAGDGAS